MQSILLKNNLIQIKFSHLKKKLATFKNDFWSYDNLQISGPFPFLSPPFYMETNPPVQHFREEPEKSQLKTRVGVSVDAIIGLHNNVPEQQNGDSPY